MAFSSAQKTTLNDAKKLTLHKHRHPHDPETTLVSTRLSQLDVGFNTSPEIYHLYFEPNAAGTSTRGKHAHRLKQEIFTCLSGSCEILLKDGKNDSIVALDTFYESLYVPAGIWHEVYFKDKCILQVISSTEYSDKERTSDYIVHYSEFRKWKKI